MQSSVFRSPSSPCVCGTFRNVMFLEISSMVANVWTLPPNLRQCSKTFCGCRTMDSRKRAATTAQRLYSTNKLNAAVELVSPSKKLWKPGISYKFRVKIPNEMAAVDSLCKNKSESSVLFGNSFLYTVPQEPDPLLNIPLQLFGSLEALPVIVWTVCSWSADYLM